MVDLANPYAKKLRELGGAILPMGAIASLQALRRSVAGAIEGYTPSAGVSGIWLPDAPNPTPHADDQEFSGASIPSGWTELDPNNLVTETYADGFAQFTRLNGTNNLCGIYRAMPPEAEWSIWCKVFLCGIPSAIYSIGLFLAEDATAPTTKKFYTVSLTQTSATVMGQANASTWTNNTTPTAVGNVSYFSAGGPMPEGYLRIGYDGTNFFSYFSMQGLSWLRLHTVAKTFTPVHAGIWINNVSGSTQYGGCDFYRVKAAAGASLTSTDMFRGARS